MTNRSEANAEWAADWLRRVSARPNRARVLVESLPRRDDEWLRRQQAYDAETAALEEVLRYTGRRGGTLSRQGRAAAARLLAAVGNRVPY